VEPPDAFLATRLAQLREHLLAIPSAWSRLPALAGVVADLEVLLRPAYRNVTFGVQASPIPGLDAATLVELEGLIESLSGEALGPVPDAVQPRARLVEVLRVARGGPLPALAFDEADAFGAQMRTMVATDPGLAAALGRLYPLILRATAVAPSATWLAGARAELEEPGAEHLRDATRRTLAGLLRAELVSRPDLLIGGLRPTNQRVARGLAWFASVALDAPAELLGAIGVRMGTSGRSDAVVRDTAVANSCAALLGASTDPGAAAALATMRVRITNRNVLKQVERALEARAARAGLSVAELVELALPTFGLDGGGRLEEAIGAWTAVVRLDDDGDVQSAWQHADGRQTERPPADVAEAQAADVRDLAERVAAVRAAIVEERRRMDERLASTRRWSMPAWRARYAEHPLGRIFGRGLVWRVGDAGGVGRSAMFAGESWIGVDGRPCEVAADGEVRLWHPVEADLDEVTAWRATLAATVREQPIRQVDREVFRPAARDATLAADRRFAGRVVDQAQLRALLRDRGWAVPMLGAWDQGDAATASRVFEDGLRAQLHYQIVERLPTGTRQERARLIAVRFVEAAVGLGADTAGGPPAAESEGRQRKLAAVPPRIYSEAIRDVSLVAVVADRPARGSGEANA
jgi:hypothetical protein